MTDDEFRSTFAQFGEIESCLIMKENTPPFISKEFGFVNFKSAESAQRCLKHSVLPGLLHKDHPLYLSFALTQSDRKKIQDIQMSISKNYPYGVPDDEIPEIFRFAPKEVVQAKIQKQVAPEKMDNPYLKLALLSDEQSRFLADDDEFFLKWIDSLN